MIREERESALFINVLNEIIQDKLIDHVLELEDENAQLRELVRIMHSELVSCEDNGYICGGHKFDKSMSGLGIEVE